MGSRQSNESRGMSGRRRSRNDCSIMRSYDVVAACRLRRSTCLVALLPLLLLLALGLLVVAQEEKGTIRQDVRALRNLMLALGGSVPRSWKNGGQDPCNKDTEHPWVGVECGKLAAPIVDQLSKQPKWHYVTHLNLAGQKLKGELPAGLGLFHGLESLDLSYNNLFGPLPLGLGKLAKLTRLDLSHNNFTGRIPLALATTRNLSELVLSSNRLEGRIPPQLRALRRSLRVLKLDNNLFAGRLSPTLGSLVLLQELNVANNSLNGSLPLTLSSMTSLTRLDADRNELSGTIPATIGTMQALARIKLSRNLLNGSIPMELGNLSRLQDLVLNDNLLTGEVPLGIARLPSLLTLSLQNNNLSGVVGPEFKKFYIAFTGNQWLCKDFDGSNKQTCDCDGDLVGYQQCIPEQGPGPCICPEGTVTVSAETTSSGGMAVGWVVVITLVCILAGLGLVVLGWWAYRSRASRRRGGGGWEYAGKARTSFPDVGAYRSQAYDPDEIDSYGVQAYDPAPKSMVVEMHPGQPPANGGSVAAAVAAAAAAAAAKKGAAPGGPVHTRTLTGQKLTLRQFSYDELTLATNNFNPNNIITSDGTWKTYSGVLPSGSYVAVKELDPVAGESADAFAVAAGSAFSGVHCPQLVEVLGFCAHANDRMLVYELMPNGSLDMHLHDLEPGIAPLDWNTRMSIALEAAKGLTYLHTHNPQMVHQALKASSVLLDDRFQVKLADYFLASLCAPPHAAPPHAASTNMAVAAGTAAPELAWASEATIRTDVYAFGVLLLEIVSGRRPIDSTRAPSEQSLIRWVKPRLMERSQVESIVDEKLRGAYSSAALYQVALLASQCIQTDPEARPTMAQAVEVLQGVQGLRLDSASSKPSTPAAPGSKQA